MTACLACKHSHHNCTNAQTMTPIHGHWNHSNSIKVPHNDVTDSNVQTLMLQA
jgi:hypothetical protein